LTNHGEITGSQFIIDRLIGVSPYIHLLIFSSKNLESKWTL